MENTGLTQGMMTTEVLVNRLIAAEVALEKQKLAEKQDKSAKMGELYRDFAKAQSDFLIPSNNATVEVFPKNGKRGYSFKFATLPEILKATVPALNAHNIAFSQHSKYAPAANGMYITVVTELLHESGAKLSYESVPMLYNAENAQNMGAVESYLCRYGAKRILGIDADDDNDGNFTLKNDPKEAFSNHKTYRQQALKKDDTSEVVKGQKEQGFTFTRNDQNHSDDKENVLSRSQTKAEMQTPTQPNTIADNKSISSSEQKNKEVPNSEELMERAQKILEEGLLRAEECGATEEQLSTWANPTNIQETIREIASFVRSHQ